MATHSVIPAWEIPWTEDHPWGHKRDGHNWVTKQQQYIGLQGKYRQGSYTTYAMPHSLGFSK